ncbi:DUF3617 family protein [Thioalkalivibrio sp.]|uniref:DUF3617 domain-containing protein n=1 Tax=Thioalkalivibrio sp. TaxID=2093813 RepID=UPI0012D607B2|nr:DUF3617 family protein [Thioalkalivibrio sp.]TVP82330.1 MAG: DUF3617 family protein [Thioalkalivibrio sp.]
MPLRSFVIATLVAIPLTAIATEPNIQPGEWEMSSITTFPGTPMPEQRDSSRECVTSEDLDGLVFDLDLEEESCEITDKVISADHMSYSMTCQHEDGMDMIMDAEMRFLGDRTEGTMDARMTTPMGPMQMRIELEGRRIGDC